MNIDGISCRSPALHRAIADHWRLRAPANDSDIIPRVRPGRGRHGDLADIAPALRTWRELCTPSEPLTSNWLAAAANDNVSEERADPYEDEWRDAPPPLSIDSEMEIRPRPEEIMRAIGDVEIAYSESCREAIPVGGDLDVHADNPPAIIGGTPCAPVARIGKLRFASGETNEPAFLYDEAGKIRRGEVRVPRGALTHSDGYAVRDRYTKWRGSADGRIDPRSIAAGPGIDDRIDTRRLAGRLLQALTPQDREVLDAALEADNFRQIGERFGFSGKTAQRQGKLLLKRAAHRLGELLLAA